MDGSLCWECDKICVCWVFKDACRLDANHGAGFIVHLKIVECTQYVPKKQVT